MTICKSTWIKSTSELASTLSACKYGTMKYRYSLNNIKQNVWFFCVWGIPMRMEMMWKYGHVNFQRQSLPFYKLAHNIHITPNICTCYVYLYFKYIVHVFVASFVFPFKMYLCFRLYCICVSLVFVFPFILYVCICGSLHFHCLCLLSANKCPPV